MLFLTLCLDTSRIEISRRFYERLGLNFSPEQHGHRGPLHFAAVLPEVPVEIYPTIKGLPSGDHFFMGFAVDDPLALSKELIDQLGGSNVEPPVPPTSSGIVTLRDPNGLLVRLFPKTQ
jgi:hypothetical protein